MGCCATREDGEALRVQRINKLTIMVNADTSVTEDLSSEKENEDFIEYIGSLKKKYGFGKYRSFWINTAEIERRQQELSFETEDRTISCELTHLDQQRLCDLKLAVVIPEWFGLALDDQREQLFLYCREEPNLQDSVGKVLQGTVSRENQGKQKKVINLICNVSSIVTMRVQIKQRQIQP